MSFEKCPKCLSLVPPGADECVRCGYYLGGGADTGFFPEQTIDKTYRLVRRIGEGGMGEVWLATDTAIGSNIMAVDVLVIHIDNSAAANIKPKISFRPSVPVLERTVSAILRCSYHFSTASANTNAPIKRNIVGCA